MLKWGVIGAGGISRVFCNAMRFSKTGWIAAVASRSADRARELAATFSIPKQYSNYESLLADDDIDVIYISTIHPTHAELAIEAAKAGKHILAEKPIGMDYSEAVDMIDTAREYDVFLMEAFAYRCHPQTHKLVELIRESRIGQVRMVRAVFSFDAPYDPKSRLYANKLGGGGILDVGCYTASMSRLIAGAASGKPFLDPIEVKGSAVLGPTGVDHYAAATLLFENDIIAEIICGVACQVSSEVSVFGTDGMIHVTAPWLPSSPARHAQSPLPPDTVFPSASIHIHGNDERIREMIKIEVDRDLYTYEADTVAENIARREAPAMSWDDSLGNMKVLDHWRKEGGIRYSEE